MKRALDLVTLLKEMNVSSVVLGEVPVVCMERDAFYKTFEVYPETVVVVSGVAFKPVGDVPCRDCGGCGGEWFDTCPTCEGSGSALKKGYGK